MDSGLFENVEYYEFSIAGLEEVQFQELAMELTQIHGVEQLYED